MIKKIRSSNLDERYLAVRPYFATPISVDLQNVLVTKPWGYEYLMFSNPETEVWNLSIKYQRSTSMHCHPNKKTALIVLAGRALFSTLDESLELMPLDAIVIDTKVFHSTQSISKEGLALLEFETPPMKHDLVRLEDKYGRTQMGYEGTDRMQLDNNNVRLSTSANQAKIHNINVFIRPVNFHRDIISSHETRTLAVLLSGIIKSESGKILYQPPHVLALEELQDASYIFEGVSVMYISNINETDYI